jgi:hypothetical protein
MLSEPTVKNSPLSKRFKLAISLLVTLHLIAVVSEPLQFFTRSTRGVSEAAAPLRAMASPYTEFAYLNHGYFFFAPEAGPSHLMRCQLKFSDGQQAQLQFPDKTAQWPRLLYHRHFMLSEFLHSLHAPPVDPQAAQGDQALFKNWQNDRNRFEMIRSSYSRHIMARYEAESVTIERIEHRLPSDKEVLIDGRPLDDPALYIVLPDRPPVADQPFPPPGQAIAPPTLGLPIPRGPINSGATAEEVLP